MATCEFLYKGKWYTEDQLRSVYSQEQLDISAPKASATTLKKVREFLDRIEVDVKTVDSITVNGNRLGINGVADALNGLILIANGKEDIALTEEAMHMAVELVEQKNPTLFKEMMNKIGNTATFNQVVADYRGVKQYQTKDGRLDIPKLKKEAIGKVLADTIINQSSPEKADFLSILAQWWKKVVDFLKSLFLRAGFNPFEELTTQILEGRENLGTIQDLKDRGKFFQTQENQDIVKANLKVLRSLRDPKAERWFRDLYQRGQQTVFFNKLQSDLQAPKQQVEMLKSWSEKNNPQTLSDIMTGVMAEMTYTVEINVSTIKGEREVFTRQLTDEEMNLMQYLPPEAIGAGYTDIVDRPTQHYRTLTVPGGVNYRENEIRTPDIAPSIKGHAQFATDKGIGWFRSDEARISEIDKQAELDAQLQLQRDIELGYAEPGNRALSLNQGDGSKIRRILEIQSDLFQKGRDRKDLISFVGDADISYRHRETGEIITGLDLAMGVDPSDRRYYEEVEPIASRENDFLQLLNKENNWVTFFVKAIIQDSAKKGYEKVRFPSGETASKIEGHEQVADYVAWRRERINELNSWIGMLESNLAAGRDIPFGDTIYRSKEVLGESGSPIPGEFEYYYIDVDAERGAREIIISKQKVAEIINDATAGHRREIDQLQREIETAEREGLTAFSNIARFYQDDVQNILRKQGYNIQEVTDEYGNNWFEVEINPDRDLGEFYFQLSSTSGDFVSKLTEINNNLSRVGDTYELNGTKVKNTVDKKVLDYYKVRLGARAEKAFNEFKQETETNVRVDIDDILSRYIDSNGDIRLSPLSQTNPSVVNPYDNTFYNTLEANIKDRLNEYPPGTKFFHRLGVYDSKTRTAGLIDLLVVQPNDEVDIFQFKVPQLPQSAADIPLFRQEAYNIEVEALRRILQDGYGVKRTQFRRTRAIPIKADYKYNIAGDRNSGLKLTNLVIGNTNVAAITDDILLPVPSASESTGNEQFDRLLSRLRGLVKAFSEERVAPSERLEKIQRVANLLASIRKLQVKRDASGILSSAKTIIKRQYERYDKLKDLIDATDPSISTVEELNKIADSIMDEKDQIELYTNLYSIFEEVYPDKTPESETLLSAARDISEDARRIIGKYWGMSVDFRQKKIAAKVGIRDEFSPEKQLTWYRRMIRSLSQSSIKAGAILWELVKRINNRFQLEFQDRLDDLIKIEEGVQKWLIGKNLKSLYLKIFQFDPQDRWNGRVIQKYSREFYTKLRRAQESGDLKWVIDNIDVQAYNDWFLEEHKRIVENAKTARVHEDDAENKKRVEESVIEFFNTFNIKNRKGITRNNYRLKDFPREDKWKSAEYLELERPENEPVLKLYNYWIKILEESYNMGMIQEHNGWSWFPNVRRNLLEKLTVGGRGKATSLFGSLRIEAEDSAFGKIDPLTGKPLDEVHANFVTDLGERVKGTDGRYFIDYSEKSMDIFKVLALWNKEIIQYKLRTESEALARMLAYTEKDRSALETTRGGALKRDKNGDVIVISNEINAKYIKDHIDAVYYGKHLSDESDVTFTIPYKAAVEKINKLFGREILGVPEEESITVSGRKAIEAMNRFFVAKTLGLNVLTSVAQLFGGTINTFINQGIFFDKKDLLEAEAEYVSGRFWASEEQRKMAGLLGYFHPFAEDRTGQEIRKLSVSGWVKTLSSDHLFYLQRGSDTWVNSIIAMSFIKNTMVENGELINIREYAKKELGYANKYQGTYEEAKSFERRLEARIEELKKSSQALIKMAQIVDDKIIIPGISRDSQTVIDFRQIILELIKNALGNTSREDLSLYKRSVMWQSFFMFKNWIPRMFDVRGQSLKYSPGTQRYEWGRIRMLWNAVRHLGLSSVGSLLKQLGGNDKSIVQIAKEIYREKQAYAASQNEDFDMGEAEFIDSYIKGVRSEFKELLLAIGLLSILITAKLASPDRDDDPEIKGAYRWMLKGLDKLTDEVIFFYSPKSFTDIVNGSVFPAVGMLVDIQKFFTTGIEKIFYRIIGDDEAAERKKVSKYLFKVLPITKELMTYVAIFNDDIAKEYGIRVASQSGSIR